MIRIREGSDEVELSYEQFIREIQEGRVTAGTPVLSEVLTSGVWKPAGELQFFRSWAPRGSVPPRQEAEIPPPPPPPGVSWAGSGHEVELPPERVAPEPIDPGLGGHPHWGGPQPEPVGGTDRVADPVPWEQMDRLGFFLGFGRTVRLAFRNPDDLFLRIGRGHALLPAMVFGLLLTALSAVAVSAYELFAARHAGPVFDVLKSQMPEFFQGDWESMVRESLLLRAVFILFYPIIVYPTAGLIHGLLRALSRPRADFNTTFRVVNYVLGVELLFIIPVCGALIAPVWVVALVVRGLARLHGVGLFTATFATLLAVFTSYICWGAILLSLLRAVGLVESP